MKFCTNCGAQLDDTAKFCTECGQRIEPAAPAAQVPAAVTPTEVHVYGAPVNHNFSPPVQAESALSDTYGAVAAASVQPEPAQTQEPVAAPTPTPAQPAAETGTYAAPVEEKKTKAPRQKKQKSGKKKSRLGLIIGIVVAVALLFTLFGGGGDSDDPNLGIYNGVSCTYGGFDMSAEGEWVELKSGGKLKMNLMGEEYSGKWELDGEDLTVTQAGDTYYGTLRNGTLVLDLSGIIYTYEKEATETPATPKETKALEETTVPAPSVSEVGYWTLKYSEGDESMAMDEETVAMLAEMGIVMYVDLAEDGTGTFMMEEAMPITWGDGKIVADDNSEVAYTLENGELIVDIQGALMHFVPGEKSSETVVSPSGDLIVNELTYYMAISGNMSGTEMNDSAIAQMGGMDIALNGDGTGTINLFGQSEEITYDNEAIYRAGIPMSYELDGDYLYFKMSDAIEFTLMVESKALDRPKNELTPNDLMYWSGDYYGYWVIDSVWKNASDWVEEGRYWDACATMELNKDGTGTLTIWDEDFPKDEPLAQMGITASETGGVGRFVCEDGMFLGLPLEHADWLWYTDATEYGDMFVINGQFDDGEDDFWYEIYLRPWGTDWSDVEAKNEPIPYYHNDWYLPMVKSGVTEAPAGRIAEEKEEQTEVPTEVPNEAPTEVPTKAPAETPTEELPFETGIVFGGGMVTLQQLKDFKEWIKDLSPKPTHEEMVAKMGVNPYPSNLNMWKEGEQAAYYWTDGKDFVTITLKPTEDGSSWTYKAISWTSGVNG